MTHDEMIAVIRAQRDGRKLECKEKWSHEWGDRFLPDSDFNFCDFDYRAKPEPTKPREFWLNNYGDRCTVNNSLEGANRCATSDRIGVIHVREVLP